MFAEVGSAGFTRDAQGRLVYRNTSAQDILVVYGANPMANAPLRAVLVSPGGAATLPAGLEGAFAASQRLGQQDWDSIVYRGAAQTPVAGTKPKAEPVAIATPETEQLLLRIWWTEPPVE